MKLVSSVGLKNLYIWPGFEFFSFNGDKTEERFMKTIKDVIKLAAELGISINLGRGPNGVLGKKAKNMEFIQRGQQHLTYVMPGSEEYNSEIIQPLKKVLSTLDGFDGWWVIDRDPGRSFGTSTDKFVDIFSSLCLICPTSTKKFTYWMWGGWTEEINSKPGWRENRQNYWSDVVTSLENVTLPGDLEYLICWPGHLKSHKNVPMHSLYFPYNWLEPEPSLPWSETFLEQRQSYRWKTDPSMPTLLNMQTPCLRTPSLISLQKKWSDKSSRVTWDQIEACWCWSYESLEKLKPIWLKVDEGLHKGNLNQDTMIKWRNHTGFQTYSRRGVLHDYQNR